MPKACDLKKGQVVTISGEPYLVKHIVERSRSRGGKPQSRVYF